MESAASIDRPLFAWTDDSCEILRAMWANGGSMTAISEMIGCSRGAVAGKIDRLKLPKRREPSGAVAQIIRRRRVRPRPNQQTVIARVAFQRAQLIPTEPVVEMPSEPPPTAKSFEELLAGECRWPYGDGLPYLFCAAPQLDGHSYCPGHCSIAHRPTPRRTTRERYEVAA